MQRVRSATPGFIKEAVRVSSAIYSYVVLNWPNTPTGIAMRRRFMERRVAAIGTNFRLMRGCDFEGYGLIRIGDNSGIAENCVIAIGPGPNELRIGTQTFIGPDVYIRNMNHRFDRLDVPIMRQGHEGTDIVIGDGVWIGARCVLLAGTKIGDHSVIAAGSVVSIEIPPYSIAAGNPVRVLRRRNST
jgi:acetyltransferase-like isoleucine patch superfamily enzyme